jgi:ribosomal RNA-processing protein 12
MHVIPSLTSEAILGTKEASEKARSAAFDLIVAMGRKMSQGGVVKKDMIDGMMDQDDAESKSDHKHGVFPSHITSSIATASVEEYMTMVAAGLTGTNPHTISATVVAISRLVFEFKGEIMFCR